MASLSIRFRPAASEELREAVEWYTARNLKTANRLCRLVKAKLTEAAKSPHHWPEQPDGTRQIYVAPFPYLLIVRETKGALEIIAFAHTSRREGYWRDRLGDV